MNVSRFRAAMTNSMDQISKVQVPPPATGKIEPAALAAEDIHLWTLNLPLSPSEIADLENLLSPAENARAARYKFKHSRYDFIACRATLRRILSAYVGSRPGDIQFLLSPFDKPSLDASSPISVKFNLSHTSGMAVFAVARNRELGVDVEKFRPDVEIPMIARRFFSEDEQTAILALPQEQQVRAFFHCWTRKEAYIKAVGKGLSIPLNQFSVSVTGPPTLSIKNSELTDHKSCWNIHDLSLGPAYAGALVAETARTAPIAFVKV